MWKVNIYIESSTQTQKKTKREYGYVMECVKNGTPFYAKGKGSLNSTYHAAILTGLAESMQRLQQNCEVTIYSRDEYVINRLKELKDMEGNNFMTKTGKPLKNTDLWRRVAKLAGNHKIIGEVGPSAFTARIVKGDL